MRNLNEIYKCQVVSKKTAMIVVHKNQDKINVDLIWVTVVILLILEKKFNS